MSLMGVPATTVRGPLDRKLQTARLKSWGLRILIRSFQPWPEKGDVRSSMI